MKKRIVVAVVLAVLLAALAYAQTPQEIAKKAFASTALLMMTDANGQPVSLGSGFLIGDKQIATNYHVIEGASGGTVKLIGLSTKYRVEGIVAVDPAHDLAILRVSVAASKTLSMADSDKVQIGDAIYAVGNPMGLEGTFSQGIVSGVRAVDSDTLIQITAPISPGSSGGPVLNSLGQVIGVSVATFEGGQNLNFVIPVNYLKTLMASGGTPKPLSTSTTASASPNILTRFGGSGTDAVSVGSFVWDAYVTRALYGNIFNGQFTISIRNTLQNAIKDVYVLVIFYDRAGDPLDAVTIWDQDVILPGLAKRTGYATDKSVQQITTPEGGEQPMTKVEYRVLDFTIVR